MSSGPFSSLELEFGGTVAKSGGMKSTSSSTAGGGESELRKQILASGALPVAIDPKKSDDGSQRYIMPSVLVKRSGAHGGAVSLSNFHFLGQCLKRPPAVLLKFLGAEFGCRVVHSKDPRGVEAHDNYTLIGSFEDDRLQAVIHKFNERCVLCHRCRDPVGRLQRAGQFGDVSKDLAKKSASFLANDLPTATGQAHVSTAPHTVAKALKGLSVGKLKPLLVLDCGGCGHVSFLDPADKLQNLLSVALAQKEEEAAKFQKLEEKKKAQLQERKKKRQQLLEKEEEGHEGLPEDDAAGIIKKEPTATNEQAEGGSLSSTAPPPSAGLAQEEGKGVEGTLSTSEEEKKVKKEKKPKKEKGGDDDTEVAVVIIPPDAVAMLVSEIKKTSSHGANIPSESSVKSLVSDVCRLFGVEGGKQAKCQLVLRALVAAGVLLAPIAPNVAALLLLPTPNTTATPPPSSDPSSSKSDGDHDGEMLKMMKDALIKGWLHPWLGSKSLTKAAAAEFSSSSSSTPPESDK